MIEVKFRFMMCFYYFVVGCAFTVLLEKYSKKEAVSFSCMNYFTLLL